MTPVFCQNGKNKINKRYIKHKTINSLKNIYILKKKLFVNSSHRQVKII